MSNVPRPISRAACLVLLVSAACGEKGAGDAASASAKPSEATCDDAGRSYAEGLARAFVRQDAKLEAKQKDITEAVMTACKEDKWDDKTLSCLAGAADYERRNGKDIAETCIKGLPADIQTKMDDRVKAKLK